MRAQSRLYRVSFSGELTYEINIPAHKGPDLWAALLHLRMEKGFLHVGGDTDGTTVPDDVGFGKPARLEGTSLTCLSSFAVCGCPRLN